MSGGCDIAQLTFEATLLQEAFSKLGPPSSVDGIEAQGANLLGTVAKVILVIGKKLDPRVQLCGVVMARMASDQSRQERSRQKSRQMHGVDKASGLELSRRRNINTR